LVTTVSSSPALRDANACEQLPCHSLHSHARTYTHGNRTAADPLAVCSHSLELLQCCHEEWVETRASLKEVQREGKDLPAAKSRGLTFVAGKLLEQL
jgi:hypothetical protein